MKPISRSIEPTLTDLLDKKVVLLSGPRQVGKTYLSRHLFKDSVYLTYDEESLRREILEKSWTRDTELVIFDELHKMRSWKRWLKGIYDTEGVRPRLLVTGSARLEAFRKSGDSLAGRHHSVRLHPFSIKELDTGNPKKAFLDILEYGGFPEPILSANSRKASLWRRSHLDVILKEDLLELEPIRELKTIEVLVQLLSERVGSTISFASLARDLQVSPHTVKNWIEILESLFVIFVVKPYTRNVAKSILKEPKVYFYDTGRVRGDQGAKIENAVACHLLKANDFLEDSEGVHRSLHYIRDKTKREVDFAIVEDFKLHSLIEVKTSETEPHPGLKHFQARLKPKHSLQLVLNCNRERDHDGLKVRDLTQFLMGLAT